MFQVPPSIAAKIATSSRWKRSTLASTSRISIMWSHSWFLCSLMEGQSITICTGVYRYCWSNFSQTAGWLNFGMVINFAKYRAHDFSLTWFFSSLWTQRMHAVYNPASPRPPMGSRFWLAFFESIFRFRVHIGRLFGHRTTVACSERRHPRHNHEYIRWAHNDLE